MEIVYPLRTTLPHKPTTCLGTGSTHRHSHHACDELVGCPLTHHSMCQIIKSLRYFESFYEAYRWMSVFPNMLSLNLSIFSARTGPEPPGCRFISSRVLDKLEANRWNSEKDRT